MQNARRLSDTWVLLCSMVFQRLPYSSEVKQSPTQMVHDNIVFLWAKLLLKGVPILQNIYFSLFPMACWFSDSTGLATLIVDRWCCVGPNCGYQYGLYYSILYSYLIMFFVFLCIFLSCLIMFVRSSLPLRPRILLGFLSQCPHFPPSWNRSETAWRLGPRRSGGVASRKVLTSEFSKLRKWLFCWNGSMIYRKTNHLYETTLNDIKCHLNLYVDADWNILITSNHTSDDGS